MKQESIAAMSVIMVEARRANESVRDVVYVALAAAAKELGSVENLVTGRPGSWEADLIRNMAFAGERIIPSARSENYVNKLAPLLVAMGKEQADGGDILSQAMGQAVNELGGLDHFLAGSWDELYWQLRGMACQCSDYWDQY